MRWTAQPIPATRTSSSTVVSSGAKANVLRLRRTGTHRRRTGDGPWCPNSATAGSRTAALRQVHEWQGRLDIVINCAAPLLTVSPLAEADEAAVSEALNAKTVG
ncbi:hypothetical protein [Streptomyces sp. NBC_00316]|uniref:hypothetical protein n=1 Tax=Streptomyces sp. NBC_00316 TaxID=2975710 RepID=UPI002E2CA584|nr:hypothetical protein [Streptomyces sp. NBC_00316]